MVCVCVCVCGVGWFSLRDVNAVGPTVFSLVMSPFISVVEASVSGRSGGGVEAAQLDAGWLERCHRNAATSHPHNRRHLSVAKGPEDGIWPDLSGSSGRACVCVCVCPSSVVASRE